MREFPAARSVEPPRRRVLSVSTLNQRIRELLESGFAQVWVEGEISNLSRPGSGHAYFSLKDDQCQVRCALFRGRGRYVTTPLTDGAQVLVRARVTMYEARGDAQLVVQEVEDAGEGALRRAFEALKRRLQEQGLFEAVHKRTLPSLPRRVGIITSPTGAAVRDIVATFRRRCPGIPLLLYPVSVQGDAAVEDIVSALAAAAREPACDVLILARGGGSLEDLKAFNDERVARAVFDCPIPVVAGVGHETDVTICDFVADQRAPTPTAAAELVSPDAGEWLARLARMQDRLEKLVSRRLEQTAQRVDWLGRMIKHPREQLNARAERLRSRHRALIGALRTCLQSRHHRLSTLPGRLTHAGPVPRLVPLGQHLARLEQRLVPGTRTRLRHRRQRLEADVARLNSVNPLAVLERGYAVVADPDSRRVIKTVQQAPAGARLDVRLSDGRLRCTVDKQYFDEG